MATRGRGRPSKISDVTEAQWTEIDGHLARGVPYKYVVDLADVTYATWCTWVIRGKEDKANGVSSEYVDFLDRITGAKNQFVRELHLVQSESEKGHKGREWVAARRHPEDFHLGTKVEHSGTIDGSHQVTVFDPSVLDALEGVDDE